MITIREKKKKNRFEIPIIHSNISRGFVFITNLVALDATHVPESVCFEYPDWFHLLHCLTLITLCVLAFSGLWNFISLGCTVAHEASKKTNTIAIR